MTKSNEHEEPCDMQPNLHPFEKQAVSNCKITLLCTNSLIVITYSSLLNQQ